MSEIKNKRLDEITEGILKSRNIGPALGEKEHVSVRDYNHRLLEMFEYANTVDPQQKVGFSIQDEFRARMPRLGYINSLALVKYINNRIKRIAENGRLVDLADLPRIPGLVAGITNGLADSRCMYDFIQQKLGSNYDMPLSVIEQEAKEFAKNYVPSPIEFSDKEQQQLRDAINSTCGGDIHAFKKMLIEMKLLPHIRQLLDTLNKIEDLENKQAK